MGWSRAREEVDRDRRRRQKYIKGEWDTKEDKYYIQIKSNKWGKLKRWKRKSREGAGDISYIQKNSTQAKWKRSEAWTKKWGRTSNKIKENVEKIRREGKKRDREGLWHRLALYAWPHSMQKLCSKLTKGITITIWKGRGSKNKV